jgi:anhydro-N-acetylmuramic acid kinase
VTPRYFVGVMSGTSLDGVDAVLGEQLPGGWRFAAASHLAYPPPLRQAALDLNSPGYDELRRAALLANNLANLYAEAVKNLLAGAAITPADVVAIGCHGQTVRHSPQSGYTLQLNNPALLAELTGIAVVADFRSRDIAAGGQGAPLVPAFHDALFRTPDRHRVILNLGGIANLTDLAPASPTRGFDCGPANMLMDAWIQQQRQQPYDRDGQWASQGHVLPALLHRLMGHDFLSLAPPKSCGREEFSLAWLHRQLAGNERGEDVQATLLAFTATTVANALRDHSRGVSELFVCGGGARNAALMTAIGERMPAVRIATTDVLGLPAEHVEAAAFAWLAARCLDRAPGNLPAVTGARGPRILGAIYPA